MEEVKMCWKETARKAGITLKGFDTYSGAIPSRNQLSELCPGVSFEISRISISGDWFIKEKD